MVAKARQKTKPELKASPVEAVIQAEERVESTPLPWLTLETCLYGAMVILAAALRLWQLGAYPLSEAEAQQSLVALGQEPAAYYSPLLVSLNKLAFLLFGSSDGSARLAGVLFGVTLTLLPLTLRRQLGGRVSLIAAALLTLSPTAVYLSRTLNAEIAVAAGALMMVAGFFNWVEAEYARQRWLFLLTGGAALILAAGTMAYSILIVFGLIVLVRLSTFKALWQQGRRAPAALSPQESVLSRRDTTTEAYVIKNPATAAKPPQTTEEVYNPIEKLLRENSHPEEISQVEPDEIEQIAPRSRLTEPDNWRRAWLFGLAGLVLLSTAALFNLNGFSRLTGALGDWLNRFTTQPAVDNGFNAVFLLAIYEPLIIIAGLVGLTFVILRGKLMATVFGGWFIGLLLLDLVMIGRPSGSVVLVLTPLIFLAAFALAELWKNIHEYATWSNEGLLLATGLTIAAFGYLGLTGWLTRTCAVEDTACQYAWLQAVAALALFMAIVAFFGIMGDAGAALRGALLVGVALGLLSMINLGWRLNYGPLSNLAYQPLSDIPASTGLVALTETLTEQSMTRAGDKTLLDVALAGVDHSALRWQLRDFKNLTTETVFEGAPARAIITPAGTELNLEESYIGQDFPIDAIWSPVGLPARDLIHWLIYREINRLPRDRAVNYLPQANRVILWLKLEPR